MSNASTSCRKLTLIITVLLGLSIGAQASNITYFTLPGAEDNAGENVNAIATFTTGPNFIMIRLTNQQANPVSVGQNLSDLIFTVSGTLTGATIGSSSAPAITVDDNGTFTSAGTVTPGWALSSTSDTITLDLLASAEAPKHTIIGPPAPSNEYMAANSSIANTGGPHNPFIDQTAMWTINAPGVTSGTTIDAVTFSFGTTHGDNNPGTTSHMGATPEISSLLLMGTGVLGLAGVLRRKLRRHPLEECEDKSQLELKECSCEAK